MVHLGTVTNDKEIQEHDESLAGGIDDLGLGGPDEFTASVYGSKYAAQDLPKHEMPEDEMPREVAHRMIK